MKALSETAAMTGKNERDDRHAVYEIITSEPETGSIEIVTIKPQEQPEPFEIVIPEIKINEMEIVIHKAENIGRQEDIPDAEESADGKRIRLSFESAKKNMGSLISGLVSKAAANMKRKILDKKSK